MLEECRKNLEAGQDIELGLVLPLVDELVSEKISPEVKASFLLALSAKGETPAEIAAFAEELRNRAIRVPVDSATMAGEILDVCGTGGDRLGTFNISTTVALVCAASGVRVAKHGNRAITSKAGSADVLESLGIPIDLEPEAAAQSLQEHGFVFLFAPRYHPAFKHLAPARRICAEQGRRTMFNFLGPLLNPARPTSQLVGVSRVEMVEPLARTLQYLGVRRGMVVSGEVPGGGVLDEFSTLGDNHLAEFHHEHGFHTSRWSASDLPLLPATIEDLAGGDSMENARLIEGILKGDDTGPRRDAVLLNSGAALMLAGRADSIAGGWQIAEDALRTGRVWDKLKGLRSRPRS